MNGPDRRRLYPLSQGCGWTKTSNCAKTAGAWTAPTHAVSERAKERGAPQLGSMGAGNHFVEVQWVDRIEDAEAAKAFGLFEGQVVAMIHCGSRGVGHQVCTDEVRTMDRAMRAYGIEVPDRQLACVPVRSPEGERYMAAMSAAANYGRANRHVLTDGVRKAFEQTFSTSARDLNIVIVLRRVAQPREVERHDVDGRERTLCVHRKGATAGVRPRHPDLPDRYGESGQPVLVPGSMGTASWVLWGSRGPGSWRGGPRVTERAG